MNKLRKDYKEQDVKITAQPIYVQVQKLTFIGVIDDSYSTNCPTGDDVEKYEHNCDSCDKYPCWDEDKDENKPERCDYEVKCGYIWYPVEFFFTMEAAKKFIEGLPKKYRSDYRTYTNRFDGRNFEMRKVLKHLGLENS